MKKFILICCICISLTIATLCIQAARRMVPENYSDRIKYKLSNGIFHKTFDCLSRPFHCIESSDCQVLCDLSKMNFDCDSKNTCTPRTITIPTQDPSSDATHSENEEPCNPKLGIIKVLTSVDPLQLEWACVSTHPLIWNDDGARTSYACKDGIITSDLTTSSFKLNDCKCRSDMVLGIFEYEPHIPRCFPSAHVNFLTKFHQIELNTL